MIPYISPAQSTISMLAVAAELITSSLATNPKAMKRFKYAPSAQAGLMFCYTIKAHSVHR